MQLTLWQSAAPWAVLSARAPSAHAHHSPNQAGRTGPGLAMHCPIQGRGLQTWRCTLPGSLRRWVGWGSQLCGGIRLRFHSPGTSLPGFPVGLCLGLGAGQERHARGPCVALCIGCWAPPKPPTPSRQHQSRALGSCPGKGEICVLSFQRRPWITPGWCRGWG